jgi:hypothetical protein
VIRTDFSDASAWEHVCAAIQEPRTADGFRADVECISDEACSGLRPEAVPAVLPADSRRPFVFVVDSETIRRPDHPVLVVDLVEQPGRTFRVVPAQAWSVENNLRLGNMGFDDFVRWVDRDGVFRGFPSGVLSALSRMIRR